MTSLKDWLKGKEVYFRLKTNDLLEENKVSKTAVVDTENLDSIEIDTIIKKAKIITQHYKDYSPASFSTKIWRKLTGKEPKIKNDSKIIVFVKERNGSVSADDHRFIEWIIKERGIYPKVYVLPEDTNKTKEEHKLLTEDELKKLKHSFWKRQWKKFKAIPAKISKDAMIAAIPRTIIPLLSILALAYVRHGETDNIRFVYYTIVAVVIALGFALIIQTVLNWITFWSEFTREAFDPQISALENWLKKKEENLQNNFMIIRLINNFNIKLAKNIIGTLRFISARGDIIIAGPLLGIGAVFLERLALGPLGETSSVFTLHGIWQLFANILVGSIASGPYSQIVAHLRSVGKITDKTSTYLGIFDSVRLQFGRLADFGFQTLYNIVQVGFAIIFWVALIISDRLFPKHKLTRLTQKERLEFTKEIFAKLQ